MKTKRFKVICSYDGTDFFGWAKQPGFPTVQQHVEQTLEVISHHHYSGSALFSWATQPRFPTVQQHVEQVLEIISRNRYLGTEIKAVIS